MTNNNITSAINSNEIIMPKSKNGSTCPLCNKKTDHTYKPFCSKRCANVDLHNWLTESYKVEDVSDSANASYHDTQLLDKENNS